MLYNDFTEKLIGLQGLKVTNIENEEKTIIIYAKMERKEHNCICCGTATDTIHDYRTQTIKDISILYYSVNISRAYFYKEEFLKTLKNNDTESKKKAMLEWIEDAENCGIPQFEKCANTMRNWYTEITNSFSTTITNGFTEGCNNKIKVLKRNAYGYQNFNRFRNRILHIFSHQKFNKAEATAE